MDGNTQQRTVGRKSQDALKEPFRQVRPNLTRGTDFSWGNGTAQIFPQINDPLSAILFGLRDDYLTAAAREMQKGFERSQT